MKNVNKDLVRLVKAVQDYNVYVAFHAGIDTGRTFNPIKFVEISF